MKMFEETCIAPVNIALIKYWGKRDEELILPINDSISMTLNTEEMCAKTTISTSSTFKDNRMWLNGEEVPFEENARLMRCLKAVQRLTLAKGNSPKFPLEWKLHIVSHNNFPTAAGLASSAAGYACLVYTLACLYGVANEELSGIARLGSGSACRSLHGGFVHWQMGQRSDGSDSLAKPIASANHWTNMHVLILVVNDERKKIASTHGMKMSMETSELLKLRAEYCVPTRITAITEAIKQRDFETFAKIIMKDSNQFHAIALDTYPPCIYMNDISHSIIHFVHAYNQAVGSIQIAYTFDAGPNACLYVLKENIPAVVKAIKISFPHNPICNNVEYFKGIPINDHNDRNEDDNNENHQDVHNSNSNVTRTSTETTTTTTATTTMATHLPINQCNLLKYIIHTKIGQGPKHLKTN